MTHDDEQLVGGLCIKAAMLMDELVPIALLRHENTEDLLDALAALEHRTQTIGKMVAAAVALVENSERNIA